LTQILEIGVMIGFLLGSYLLAKNRSRGWLFFMLMNVSMGSLMLLQDKPILAFQQAVSLCFVVYGYLIARRSPAPAENSTRTTSQS
jgi:nicotinamide riboside transporter PnuC